jgi:hypothetical protein
MSLSTFHLKSSETTGGLLAATGDPAEQCGDDGHPE